MVISHRGADDSSPSIAGRDPEGSPADLRNPQRADPGRRVPPGSYLPAAGLLLEEFGVSRPTLREALNALETDGLIQLRRGPNGGAIVQNPDNAAIIRQLGFLLRFEGTTMEELMDVRLVVDPWPPDGSREWDEGDIERIRESLERQRDKKIETTRPGSKRISISIGPSRPDPEPGGAGPVRIAAQHHPRRRPEDQVQAVRAAEEHRGAQAVYTAIAEGDRDEAAESIRSTWSEASISGLTTSGERHIALGTTVDECRPSATYNGKCEAHVRKIGRGDRRRHRRSPGHR